MTPRDSSAPSPQLRAAGHGHGHPTGRRAPLWMAWVLVVVLLGAVPLSSAAFTDSAQANLGGGGIGFGGVFDIAVVTPSGTVEQANQADGYALAVSGADQLVPGHSVTSTITVFNNTPRLAADTTMTVALRGDGSVAGAPNIVAYLRFTAKDAAGRTLFTGVTWDQAKASLGVLAPRVAAPLTAGSAYVADAAGTSQTVTLTITYLDVAGVEALNGGQAALLILIQATSVRP